MVTRAFNIAAQTAEDISAIENSLNKRLGELISDILGEHRVKELFEAAGGHPDPNLSTADIAMQQGVISANTKTALLTAQAAVRALDLSDRAAGLASGEIMICTTPKILHDDKLFKFVGSENDPPLVKQAQATWMAAQLYFNEEKDAKEGMTRSLGSDHSASFDHACPLLLTKASVILGMEGHAEAADRILKLAKMHDARFLQAGLNAPPVGSIYQKLVKKTAEKAAEAGFPKTRPAFTERFEKLAEFADTLASVQPVRPQVSNRLG